MLDAARAAPSGGNTQPWHFIVVQSKEKIQQMENIIREKIEELPEILKRHGVDSKAVAASHVNGWKRSSLFFSGAPLTIAVLTKDIPSLYYDPYVKYVMEKRGMDQFNAFKYLGLVETMSVAAAIENLLLAAHSLGYGSCWLRVPFMAKDELEKMLSVRPPWYLIALIPIGCPDPSYSPPKVNRKDSEELVTYL